MTQHIIVRHRVSDFEKWKQFFLDHQSARKDSGFNHANVFTEPGDQNNVLVHLMTDDIDKAKRFMESDELKQVMKEAGVIEAPVVYFHSFSS